MGGGRAVVIGGSIAGVCAAKALSRHFEHVTVLERDTYPEGVDGRPGVPQSRHVHALLARGLRELDALFPGFEEGLRHAGAVDINFGMDFAALRTPGWAPRVPIDLQLLFASRALIETTLRDLCRTVPNVEICERLTVTGLLAANGRVTGVRASTGVVPADLVVDASGRGTKVPQWLPGIGVEPPKETVVDALAGYSTRWFRAPDRSRWPADWWWKGIWIDPILPELTRAAVLFPVENDQWIVTLGGFGGNYPPTDEEGFSAELERLRSPILAEAVKLATPISPVYGNRSMANRLRHYETSRTPPGLVAVADATCCFNPVYGQGMTSAALSATVLGECLERYGALSPDLPRRFFAAQAKAKEDIWGLATGADFLVTQTVGERPFGSNLVVPYFKALLEASMDDTVVLHRFLEVINLLRPSRTLFAPSIALRIASGALRRRFAQMRGGGGISAMPPPLSATARSEG